MIHMFECFFLNIHLVLFIAVFNMANGNILGRLLAFRIVSFLEILHLKSKVLPKVLAIDQDNSVYILSTPHIFSHCMQN